ncbi:RDD family protein [Nocardia stercoris]|uniref:RDD family protein n=1 Tax=Nocardia stercoris TaxID=2483361 RepID=A0A3M2KXL9_9NOCA|nr:RDD family protein [Nocardia stercoris]RMI29814.1 RDD family protein [Nocardia stercoris]
MTPPEPGLFGRVVGAVTGKVVEIVPVEQIVEEIDVDALLERVDLDRLLDRVDVNRFLDRVDVERLLDRVDVEELVQRAGIADVVARTTMGLAGRTLDVVRRELAGLDRIETGIVDRVLRRRGPAPLGPPALVGRASSAQPDTVAPSGPAVHPPPGPDTTTVRRPKTAAAVGRTTVSGRYAGPVSRAAAAAIDVGVILGAYSLAFWLVGVLAKALFGFSVGEGNGIVASTLLAVWAALYLTTTTAISGRTVGKGIIGLTVVSRTGSPVRPRAALVRTLAFPLSTIFAIGLALIALRRDHRALHDLIARTAVVYDWGDRPAQLSAPLTAFLRAHDAA